jgi:hypothetical protein
MKIALVALFFAASALAQDPSVITGAACGPANVDFKVKLDDTQHTLAQPEPGKARVYFLMDAGTTIRLAYPTAKIGMDGAWVGANHGNSYFSVSVEPGEHHLCATLQSSFIEPTVELAHFTAEAGKLYYYRTRIIGAEGVLFLELYPVDSDQARYLIAAFPLSVSTPKK